MLLKNKQQKYSESRIYSIHLDGKVIRFLRKLPKDLSHIIFKKIYTTRFNPDHFFERLSGRSNTNFESINSEYLPVLTERDT